MHLEIRDFRLIEAVLRLGSLGQAARELHRTPSALSHQLAALERRVARPLFTRAAKRLVPTAVAERLARRARAVLAETTEAEAEIDVRPAAQVVLRITTECYSCYAWLPPLLAGFRALHPAAGIRLNVGATFRPLAALLADKIDLALICSQGSDRRFRYQPVFTDEFVALVASGHPWSRRRFVTARDLASQPLIVTPLRWQRSRMFRELFAGEGVAPQSVTGISLTEAVLEMAKEGIGVGILPRWTATTYLAAGGLHAVRITPAGLQREWRAVIRAVPDAPRHVRGFLDVLAHASPGVPSGSAPSRVAFVRKFSI